MIFHLKLLHNKNFSGWDILKYHTSVVWKVRARMKCTYFSGLTNSVFHLGLLHSVQHYSSIWSLPSNRIDPISQNKYSLPHLKTWFNQFHGYNCRGITWCVIIIAKELFASQSWTTFSKLDFKRSNKENFSYNPKNSCHNFRWKIHDLLKFYCDRHKLFG